MNLGRASTVPNQTLRISFRQNDLSAQRRVPRALEYTIEIQTKNALTTLPPLTQPLIIAEVRPERNLAGAFSFLAPGKNGTPHPHISLANQRLRPMMRISSAVRS